MKIIDVDRNHVNFEIFKDKKKNIEKANGFTAFISNFFSAICFQRPSYIKYTDDAGKSFWLKRSSAVGWINQFGEAAPKRKSDIFQKMNEICQIEILKGSKSNIDSGHTIQTTATQPSITTPNVTTAQPSRTPPPSTTTPSRTPPPTTQPSRTQPSATTTQPSRTPPPSTTTPSRTPPLTTQPSRTQPSATTTQPSRTPPPSITTPSRTPPPTTQPFRTQPSATTTQPSRTPPPSITTPSRTPPPTTQPFRTQPSATTTQPSRIPPPSTNIPSRIPPTTQPSRTNPSVTTAPTPVKAPSAPSAVQAISNDKSPKNPYAFRYVSVSGKIDPTGKAFLVDEISGENNNYLPSWDENMRKEGLMGEKISLGEIASLSKEEKDKKPLVIILPLLSRWDEYLGGEKQEQGAKYYEESILKDLLKSNPNYLIMVALNEGDSREAMVTNSFLENNVIDDKKKIGFFYVQGRTIYIDSKPINVDKVKTDGLIPKIKNYLENLSK